MLTCIARSKQSSDGASSADPPPPGKLSSAAPPSKAAIRILSSQIKDMALKATGAYRHFTPCAAATAEAARRSGSCGGGGLGSERFRRSFRQREGRRELEARLKGISSGEGASAPTPPPASGRRADPVVFVEESEPKEWVAQVEPGVVITFVSLPRGGNDLKQMKFSQEMFNKKQAQRWWADNFEKVTELYNVKKLNRRAFPRDDSEYSAEGTSNVAPPLSQEGPTAAVVESSRQDSLEQSSMQSVGANAKTEASTVGADPSGEGSVASAETEWIEEDEPGVHITIRALPNGRREIIRVRFSREKFGVLYARVWWEENKARILKQYL